MIKFLVSGKDGRRLVGLGLTDENIERLRRNEPIVFDLASVLPGVPGTPVDVLIVHGETHEAIKHQLKEELHLNFPDA